MSDPAENADPDRQAILRRRQRFIASALSGLAASAATGCPQPQPCLSVVQPSPSASPIPCLEATRSGEGETGGAKTGGEKPEGEETGLGQGEPAKAPPQPCLSVPYPGDREPKDLEDDLPAKAPPQPCLSVPNPNREPERKGAEKTEKTEDTGAAGQGDAQDPPEAPPQPCLRVRRGR